MTLVLKRKYHDVSLGFSLRAFKRGSQRLPKRRKGVFDYDSGFFCFKEVETAATILLILAFKPEMHQNTNP